MSITTKLDCLTVELSKGKKSDKNRLNSVFAELNALITDTAVLLSEEDCNRITNVLTLYRMFENLEICVKASHLMTRFIIKFNYEYNFGEVLNWHLSYLNQFKNEQLVLDVISVDILENLKSLLSYRIQYWPKLQPYLEVLLNLIKQQDLRKSLLGLQFVCQIVPFLVKGEIGWFYPDIFEVVIPFLMRGFEKSHDEVVYYKVVMYSLKILCQLCFAQKELSNALLPELMGICRYFVLYGLIPQPEAPAKIMPAQQTVAAPVTNNPKTGKKQKLRKQKSNAVKSIKTKGSNSDSDEELLSEIIKDSLLIKSVLVPSDSDMSDVENSKEAKHIALKAKIRQCASNLLLILVKKVESKVMFGYWWAFLPDSPDPERWCVDEGARRTLTYCAVHDPIRAGRETALQVLLAFLSRSRLYLLQAETSKKKTSSFIPFSESLGYTIACLHTVLYTILVKEHSLSVILVGLKCCAALVQATNYHKLKEGMITQLLLATRKFLYYKDVRLQVGALTTIGCFLSIDPKVEELTKVIEKDSMDIGKTNYIEINNKGDDEVDDFEEGYSDDEIFYDDKAVDKNKVDVQVTPYFKSWVLDKCFMNLGFGFKGNDIVKCKQAGIKVVYESLQVISSVAFHHFEGLLVPHLGFLASVLCDTLCSGHQEVVLLAARTISIIGDAILKLEGLSRPPPLQQCVTFWREVLSPLAAILQGEESVSKAAACDCIANIGERTFRELPSKMEVLCCTLMVGLCGDSEELVRGAAVRACACVLVYRTLREDISFVSDCAENILRALSESAPVLRGKAAWALGNLTHVLLLNREDPEIHDDIDDELFLRLFETCIDCASDNDVKIKLGGVRGLGSMLRLVSAAQLSRHAQLGCGLSRAASRLAGCAARDRNMKLRWNCCYAMGSALKNDVFYKNPELPDMVFTELCNLVAGCKSVKVRITSAVALRSPPLRSHYGARLPSIWAALDEALTDKVTGYTEHQHKDNLMEQVLVTMAHLCCLLSPGEWRAFSFSSAAPGELQQVCRRLPPEHPSSLHLLRAAKHLASLENDNPHVKQLLQNIFVWDI